MEKIHDVVIVGAGPSALTAAIYTSRENLDTLLIEKSAVGGLVAITHKISNYPGFPDGIEGFALSDLFRQQAEKFGSKFQNGTVTSVGEEGDYKFVEVDGQKIKAKAVLIASGSNYGKIGIKGEKEYRGHGVHNCATCDGAFYTGKSIVVIGGGNTAIQEALFLAKFASHIDILVRSVIRASKTAQDELDENIKSGKIAIHMGTTPIEIVGDGSKVSSVKAEKEGKKVEFTADGVFVFAGLEPNTEFLHGSKIELDDHGFVVTDEKMQAGIDGIFASGDVRSKTTKQVACAVGDGAAAAINIREYLSGKKA